MTLIRANNYQTEQHTLLPSTHVRPAQLLLSWAAAFLLGLASANASSVELTQVNVTGQPAGRITSAPLTKCLPPWTQEKARQWHDRQPWLVGCNFLPSTAVNDIEMWQSATYDPQSIDRELALAQSLGFNTIRVFLNFVVWQAAPDAFKKRIDDFLAIAARHNISVLFVLLDDCNFANRAAKVGPQPSPIPGVSNSQWVSSPPLAMVTDRSAWPDLESYVKDILGTFAKDPRVVVWDIYNESGNSGLGESSLPLVEAAFTWAREVNPAQPLTSCVWSDFKSNMSQRIMELSDVVSFHSYVSPAEFRAQMALCQQSGRPLICTEWLYRPNANTFESILPLLRDQRVASYNWGLVAGRTQTFMHWGSKPGTPIPKLWMSDIFHADGTPYSADEVTFIKSVTAAPQPRP